LADEQPPLSDGLRPTLMAAFASAVGRVLDTEVRGRLLAGEPVDHVTAVLEPLTRELFDTAEAACRQAPSGL
jgi:hypothetical protein